MIPRQNNSLRNGNTCNPDSLRSSHFSPLLVTPWAQFFYNAEDMALIDYIPHNETVTDAYYADLQQLLHDSVHETL